MFSSPAFVGFFVFGMMGRFGNERGELLVDENTNYKVQTAFLDYHFDSAILTGVVAALGFGTYKLIK